MAIETIVLGLADILIKLGLKKKEEADKSKADAMEKTVASVGHSLAVEKGVRDDQKAVDKSPTNVVTPEGGCNFDSFNNGEEKK